jgi:hypothetical protein
MKMIRYLTVAAVLLGASLQAQQVPQVWESLEKIEAFRNSPPFQEAREIGDRYATFRSYAIQAVQQSVPAPARRGRTRRR